MKMRTKGLAIAAIALLAACGRHEGRGGLTPDEERQLDEAAKMLDDNMIDVSGDSLSDNEAQLDAIGAAATNDADANAQ
jgi:hypothetical protein